jgi:hypothetical protein
MVVTSIDTHLEALLVMKGTSWLISLAILLGIWGCASSSGYSGDGKFVDRGWLQPERYVLDLGAIDLSRTGKYAFRLAGLPQKRMTVGLAMTESDESGGQKTRPYHTVRVRIDMETGGHTVMAEDAPLGEWTWTRPRGFATATYYRQGRLKYVPLREGVTKPEAIDEKYSKGWGTSFEPQADRTYLLTIEVVGGDSTAPSARLLVTGAGLDYP